MILITAPMWFPLMLAISVMIKSVSRGTVLFRQERIGLQSRRFMCLKFRTMKTGADTLVHERHMFERFRSNAPMTKLDGRDPRLIPLAWLLRSTGLDELPQLFNVLRGEMSLVGPRPGTLPEYENYSVSQRARLETPPGLTGLWQVSGKNRTTFSEMIELDIRYCKSRTLWMDLAILCRTPPALLVQVAETLIERKWIGSLSGEILLDSGQDSSNKRG